jgi:hypothetical protein
VPGHHPVGGDVSSDLFDALVAVAPGLSLVVVEIPTEVIEPIEVCSAVAGVAERVGSCGGSKAKCALRMSTAIGPIMLEHYPVVLTVGR